jgi:RNA polymerase sigma factor (sigma-70 family)
MSEPGWLTDQFEHWRPHLTSVAYGMLGSVSEAEDGVQQAWLRLGRSESEAIIDLRAWLTTVVGRICLDMLRARKNHRVEYLGARLPEPLVEEPAADGPEEQAVIADSVGLALLVVLDSLSPSERLAFVLHNVFDMRFEEVGQIIGRTDSAARQLASRAHRRVRAAPQPSRSWASPYPAAGSSSWTSWPTRPNCGIWPSGADRYAAQSSVRRAASQSAIVDLDSNAWLVRPWLPSGSSRSSAPGASRARRSA